MNCSMIQCTVYKLITKLLSILYLAGRDQTTSVYRVQLNAEWLNRRVHLPGAQDGTIAQFDLNWSIPRSFSLAHHQEIRRHLKRKISCLENISHLNNWDLFTASLDRFVLQCWGQLFLRQKYGHIVTDGRLRLLSLTLYNVCCMMNYIVYLSNTEGSVPPSANERGVTGER